MEFYSLPGSNPKKSYRSGALADWHKEASNTLASDLNLIQRVAAQDVAALAILYDRYAEIKTKMQFVLKSLSALTVLVSRPAGQNEPRKS